MYNACRTPIEWEPSTCRGTGENMCNCCYTMVMILEAVMSHCRSHYGSFHRGTKSMMYG